MNSHFRDPPTEENVNDQTPVGFTRLHEACMYGDSALARTLLALGADVTIQMLNGGTPLNLVSHNQWELLAIMADYNAPYGQWIKTTSKEKTYKALLEKRRQNMAHVASLLVMSSRAPQGRVGGLHKNIIRRIAMHLWSSRLRLQDAEATACYRKQRK